jgi:HEAT repeat protein
MSNTLILIAVVVAAGVAVLAGVALRRQRNTTSEVASPGIQLDPILAGFVDAVHTSASETEERYVRALALLRQNPDNAARLIETAYRSAGSQQIRLRESLLLAAQTLGHRSVLPLLVGVAREPVSGTVRHDGGRAAEESILRMMAVDGIEAIARAGDTDAADALLALAASPDRGVQASAVVALKYSEIHRAHYEKLRGALSPDRLYLLDIVRASVRDVPQVTDPRRHLLSEPTTVDTRPDLESGARRNSGVPSPDARVPRAVGRGERNG